MQIPSLTKFTRYPKMIIWGPPGLGKSTFAAGVFDGNIVFIPTTDGLEGLSVQAFPVATTAEMIRSAIRYLATEEHKFKAVCLDTLGWMEKLVHDEVCQELNLDFMTQSSMKSYPLASKKMREILESLDDLNKRKKMMVIMIGHAIISKFEAPESSSYDHYSLQMNEKVAEMFLQDADIVGFMNQKVMIREEKEGFSKVNKATGSARWMYFDPRPAYYAKDHGYGLPDELQIEEGKGWESVWAFIKAKFATQPKEEKKEKLDLAISAEAQKERRAERAKAAKEVKIDDSDDLPQSHKEGLVTP